MGFVHVLGVQGLRGGCLQSAGLGSKRKTVVTIVNGIGFRPEAQWQCLRLVCANGAQGIRLINMCIARCAMKQKTDYGWVLPTDNRLHDLKGIA